MQGKNEQKEENTVVERVDRKALFKLVMPGFFSNLVILLSMREAMGYKAWLP